MTYHDKPSLRELDDSDELMHYGMPRRSGRYPWGSGKEPYQHSGDFLARVESLKKSGMTEKEIAETMGIVTNHNGKDIPSTTMLRTQVSLAKDERRALDVATAKSLREDGLSLNQIKEKMGFKNDSSVRSLLNENSEARMNQAKKTANELKKLVDEKGMIDVGKGVEKELGISSEKLKQALYILELEGYPSYGGRVDQVTNPGKKTTLKVLCPPGTEHKAIYDYSKINSLKEYVSRDGGSTIEKKFHYPESMDSKRLKIRYNEEGGIEKDGLIEIRRNVPDLSLGESRYSQVRILVDGTHYIKGMAVYSDKMPDGVDIVFNTNKKKGTPVHDVLKKIKNDPDNPFGSSIKDSEQGGQYWYTDKNGKKKLGLINKRADEGDWGEWKDKLPSQFLSKQTWKLAKQQLGLAVQDKVDEYNSICSLTNPTVKKKLLESFSDDCDSSAVHLYAAALPRQKYHVLIPIPELKDNEIYAPNYKNGEEIAAIRFPHGGTFEIPLLKVNNKHKIAKELLGNAIDAVGINSRVAERLSGADFDGDTVMTIPNNGNVKIKSQPLLTGLIGFDPKFKYGTTEKIEKVYDKKTGKYKEETSYYNDHGKKIKIMNNTQNEMGRISNLITDMTLKGAKSEELAAAVRHSMVVIDAEKHKLDYKKSYIDNNIEALKRKYQGVIDENGRYSAGASTLISRAKSETSVPKRQGTPKVNIKGKDWYDPSKPEGALLYKTADDLYYPDRSVDKKTGLVTLRTAHGNVTYRVDDETARKKYEPVKRVDEKTGKVTYTNAKGDIEYKTKMRTDKSTKMAETHDAKSLISDADTAMERLYADYANKMKSLGNQARKEMVTTGKIAYSKSAKLTYQKEVDSLMSKLNQSLKNAPKERRAQTIVNSVMDTKKKANPDMTKEEIKKLGQRELTKARELVGAKREPINVTDKEWEAIQAGAISENKLTQILNHADIDVIREKATPRTTMTLSAYKVNRIASMNARGCTIKQIADTLGISTSTVNKHLKGKE
ncbi:MAG: helix-turn-helix domain-containing protein [Clostridium sp.]